MLDLSDNYFSLTINMQTNESKNKTVEMFTFRQCPLHTRKQATPLPHIHTTRAKESVNIFIEFLISQLIPKYCVLENTTCILMDKELWDIQYNQCVYDNKHARALFKYIFERPSHIGIPTSSRSSDTNYKASTLWHSESFVEIITDTLELLLQSFWLPFDS